MKEEEKQWFLIKSSWIDWLEDLSMEDRGEFFTALYTKEIPNGIAGAFIKNNIEEFNRVNQYSQKKREINQRNGLSGGAPRGNTNAVKKTTEKQPKNNPKTTNYQAIIEKIQPKNKHIDIDTSIDTSINKDIVRDKEIENSIDIIDNNYNKQIVNSNSRYNIEQAKRERDRILEKEKQLEQDKVMEEFNRIFQQ